tara:strand:+ start:55 stop:579 length:525 start_codon:yes stop_codon:yes gene_type:complete
MNKKDFWYSNYRWLYLPYALDSVNNIPSWHSSSTGTKYTFIILNRNYNLISRPEARGSSTITNRFAEELVGSVVSFTRYPEDFKNVWHSYPYLYNDEVGENNKSVEDYLERLTKLFTHRHKFLSHDQIESLQDSIDQNDDYDQHLACDGWPNCDSMPELCQDYGHKSQMIGFKD